MPARRCVSGKARFPTHTAALVALVEVVFDLEDRQRSTRTKCPQRTYCCPDCKGWHLTALEYRGDRHWVYGWWLTATANRVGSEHKVSRIPPNRHSHRKAS